MSVSLSTSAAELCVSVLLLSVNVIQDSEWLFDGCTWTCAVNFTLPQILNTSSSTSNILTVCRSSLPTTDSAAVLARLSSSWPVDETPRRLVSEKEKNWESVGKTPQGSRLLRYFLGVELFQKRSTAEVLVNRVFTGLYG